MLTGDNARTAAALAGQAGIMDVRAELRPEDKATAVAELSKSQPTAMIGDGINDAPALAATADVGIAMGARSRYCDRVGRRRVHRPRPAPHPTGLAHARRGRNIINQNVVLSIAIIVVLLPLAITGVLELAAVVAAQGR